MKVRLRSLGDALAAAAQAVLLTVALAGLGGFFWLEYEQRAGQAELRERFEAVSASPTSPRRGSVEETPLLDADQRSERSPEPSPHPDGLVGRLVCDRIGLDVIVVDGVDRATLRRAAGRDPRGVRPGEMGNVAIAAHRDTYFRPLRNVDQGDEIRLETPDGEVYTYVVDWVSVVEPTNVRPLDPTDQPALTLVTCFPFDYIGSAPRRYIVRAVQKVA